MEVSSVMTAATAGGAITWAGQSVVAFIKARGHRSASARAQAEQTERHALTEANEIDRHRDKLTFDLLQAAREEVALARKEAAETRNLQVRLHFFDEALDHLTALLLAADEGDKSGTAERRARAFLLRMTNNGPSKIL